MSNEIKNDKEMIDYVSPSIEIMEIELGGNVLTDSIFELDPTGQDDPTLYFMRKGSWE